MGHAEIIPLDDMRANHHHANCVNDYMTALIDGSILCAVRS